jgi:hypothetical protein
MTGSLTLFPVYPLSSIDKDIHIIPSFNNRGKRPIAYYNIYSFPIDKAGGPGGGDVGLVRFNKNRAIATAFNP